MIVFVVWSRFYSESVFLNEDFCLCLRHNQFTGFSVERKTHDLFVDCSIKLSFLYLSYMHLESSLIGQMVINTTKGVAVNYQRISYL